MSFYSDYVKKMYTCIKEASNNHSFTYSIFAEGPDALKKEHTGSQEYVILRNDYARLFVDVMNSHHFYDASGGITYTLKKSLLQPNEVSISHSCYPRNLRRWVEGGTISRKKKCRAEFCALAWCWYSQWLEEINHHLDKTGLRQSLLENCRDFTEQAEPFGLHVLWKASVCAYEKSFGRS